MMSTLTAMKWPVRDLRLPLQRAKRLTINKGVLLEYTEIKGRGCEKSPLKVKRTLSGMKPGGVLFFVVKLSYYE